MSVYLGLNDANTHVCSYLNLKILAFLVLIRFLVFYCDSSRAITFYRSHADYGAVANIDLIFYYFIALGFC